jgi:hypothetical protein
VRPKVDLRAGKVAEDDYNDGADCKRRAVTSTAIEDMDWSSMTEDYVCFTETFDADAELSELCDDGESDAAGSSSSNDKDSDDPYLVVILCLLPTGLLVVIAILILVMIKRRKPAKPPSAAAPPAHEPTAPPQPPLASIEASNLKLMRLLASPQGMMSEEPPQAAEPIAEAIVPHGHVSGAEAAAMAAGEPPPQPSEGWGRRSLQRMASWRAVEEPPPPLEPEFEPEC